MLKEIYLQVILGIPVRIKNDAGVCCSEVDAQAPSPGAEQEDEAIWVWFAEAVDGRLPEVPAHTPVDALVQVPAQGHRHSTHCCTNGFVMERGLWTPLLLTDLLSAVQDSDTD